MGSSKRSRVKAPPISMRLVARNRERGMYGRMVLLARAERTSRLVEFIGGGESHPRAGLDFE